jgi:hypothetical protein
LGEVVEQLAALEFETEGGLAQVPYLLQLLRLGTVSSEPERSTRCPLGSKVLD